MQALSYCMFSHRLVRHDTFSYSLPLSDLLQQLGNRLFQRLLLLVLGLEDKVDEGCEGGGDMVSLVFRDFAHKL